VTTQRTETIRDDAVARAKTLIAKRCFAGAALALKALLDASDGGKTLPAEVRRDVSELLDACMRRLRSKADLPLLQVKEDVE
jgi:hypothetical protein